MSSNQPLEIDWDNLLQRRERSPPPELHLVSSDAAVGGDGGGEDALFNEAELADVELPDQPLQDKIQRMTKLLSNGISSRLPDNGVKLRRKLLLMQDELDRRKLAGGRKTVAGCSRITVVKNTQSRDSIDVPKANSTESRSLVHCSFTSKLLEKIEGKEDDASSKDMREVDQNQISFSGKKVTTMDKKKRKIEISMHNVKLTSRESSFQYVTSLANKDQQKSSNGFNKDSPTGDTIFFEGKNHSTSKRRRVSEKCGSREWNFEKVKEVVLLDEDEIEDAEPKQGKISEQWKEVKIYYPSRDDPNTVEISYEDLKCLDPQSYLSSTIMNFYIQDKTGIRFEKSCCRYLQRPQSSNGKSRDEYHFFNTYFYNKLEEAVKGDKTACFLKLRRWWKGVNIFQKSYIFIPIHGDLHWSLVIVCIPAKEEESGPIILHLDSLGIHSSHSIFYVVSSYLKEEWNHVNGSSPSTILERIWKHLPRRIEKKKITVPQQKNEFDCGLFVLYFIERFIEEAPERLKRKDLDMFGSKWFHPEEASGLRKHISRLLLKFLKSSEDKNEEVSFSPEIPKGD